MSSTNTLHEVAATRQGPLTLLNLPFELLEKIVNSSLENDYWRKLHVLSLSTTCRRPRDACLSALFDTVTGSELGHRHLEEHILPLHAERIRAAKCDLPGRSLPVYPLPLLPNLREFTLDGGSDLLQAPDGYGYPSWLTRPPLRFLQLRKPTVQLDTDVLAFVALFSSTLETLILDGDGELYYRHCIPSVENNPDVLFSSPMPVLSRLIVNNSLPLLANLDPSFLPSLQLLRISCDPSRFCGSPFNDLSPFLSRFPTLTSFHLEHPGFYGADRYETITPDQACAIHSYCAERLIDLHTNYFETSVPAFEAKCDELEERLERAKKRVRRVKARGAYEMLGRLSKAIEEMERQLREVNVEELEQEEH
ncbi:hypothetical protein JCM8547_007159 [Rhodosporidiobolus lusitaniae]